MTRTTYTHNPDGCSVPRCTVAATATAAPITFRIGGKAYSTIEGSELAWDPVKYDGGSQGARDACTALQGAVMSRRGRSQSYSVTTTEAGAAVIAHYCRTVGETFAMETEADTRSEGRALLTVADAIAAALA